MTNTTNTPNTSAAHFWNLVKSGVSRYDAFLQVRMFGAGTYGSTTGQVRRWTARDGSLVLDVNADARHIFCVRG